LLRQLEIVIFTLELLGTVFHEEAPHKIFGPFGRLCLFAAELKKNGRDHLPHANKKNVFGVPQYRLGVDKPKQLRTSVWFALQKRSPKSESTD
jgi:hypothetical protein